MSTQNRNNKNDIANLHLIIAECNSMDSEASQEYLASNGINTDMLIADGLKRIKRMRLRAAAKETEKEMEASESIQSEAIAWVDQLLNKVDFSLTELVQKEELSISFRNVENLSKDDIRNILIRHYTLKFMNQQNNRGK